jgi:hypothetical protein
MRQLLWFVLIAVLLGSGPAIAARHHWVPVPHQRGIRVDMNSIEHGEFPTGGISSPMADTRALIDVDGNVQSFTVGCDGHAPPELLVTTRPHDEKLEQNLAEIICGRRVWSYDPSL